MSTVYRLLSSRALIATILSSALSLVTLNTPSASALVTEEDNRLAAVERKIFLRSYKDSGESISARLTRLENRFFGEASKESDDSRLARIIEAAGPIESSEPSKNESPGKIERSLSSKTDSKKKPHTSTKFEDPDAAWEKASVNALEARDQEIRKILKDGINAWKRKESAEAERLFNQVIRLDPQNQEAFFSLGVVKEGQGDLKQALALYSRAHDLNPDNLSYKEAIVTLKEKLQGSGESKEIQALRARAAAAFKRKELISALELYKQLEKQSPENDGFKYNIGTIYLMMQDKVQALEYYRKARKLKPKEERYINSCKKLEIALKEEEQDRKAQNQQWDKNSKKKKSDRPKNTATTTASQAVMRSAPQTNQSQIHSQGHSQNLGANYLQSLGLMAAPAANGVLVAGVGIGSRAARAGLQQGDVIVAVDGITIQHIGQLITILSRKPPNEMALVLVSRAGQVGQIKF